MSRPGAVELREAKHSGRTLSLDCRPTTRATVTRRKPMPKWVGLTLVLGAAVALVIFAKPAGAIDCVRGLQWVDGQMLYTPYCQDEYLAEVAREFGFKASAAKIRNNPTSRKRFAASSLKTFEFKSPACRLVCRSIGGDRAQPVN